VHQLLFHLRLICSRASPVAACIDGLLLVKESQQLFDQDDRPDKALEEAF
jgi:hypothetical protein